ncbi:MAG: hypothetical protein JXR91_03275 [Deltaproteobacteria bacterium]|nr:hypothetical protein [Deltaproteobacteria bacterium]
MLSPFSVIGFDHKTKSADLITLDPGKFSAGVQAGTDRIDRSYYFTASPLFRAGVHKNVELFYPLGISLAPVKKDNGSGLAFSSGVTGLQFTQNFIPVFTPSFIISGALRVSSTARLKFLTDYLFIINISNQPSPSFVRGAGALAIEIGPYLTFSFGISYQSQVTSGYIPPTDTTGFYGVSRISIGSVKTAPYWYEPLFNIHAGEYIDIVATCRFDINNDNKSNDLIMMGGLIINPGL